ncbi:DUF7490 domain-containing protein [Halovivax limisalsi]|uniref:DUF7490 domain-containing protein n=1 Tax=Halovivax limisalsi TaxID=1453760 RepID=UPI001FFD4E45|nr:PGF-CTERM sorting domain-containing protein [Halovivax limisalsi]
MHREQALVIVAGLVLVATLSTLSLSGAIAVPDDPEPAVEPPERASLAEVTVAAEEVTGETATIALETALSPEITPVENLTVVHRATDAESGLQVARTEQTVETLEADREYAVSGALELPRTSAYQVETILYVDGVRGDAVTRTIEGVETLTPGYAATDVEFHRFGGVDGPLEDVPAIEFTVESTEADRASLDVASFLTNTGDDPETGLELAVTARQSDSNVVADSATVDVGEIEGGETVTPSVTLDVPTEYDYYLDATLWRGDTIVATDRATANLGPGNLTVDRGGSEGGIQVSDFEPSNDRHRGEDGTGASDDGGDDGADATGHGDDGTPGFGVITALVALLAIGLRSRRTSHD